MSTFLPFLRRLSRDSGGATAIEYALVASLIAVAILASVMALAVGVGDMWAYIWDAILNA